MSIYELIKKNIQFDGRLKKDFRILDENVWKGNDDGQEDVQCLNMIEADIKGLLDIIFKRNFFYIFICKFNSFL